MTIETVSFYLIYSISISISISNYHYLKSNHFKDERVEVLITRFSSHHDVGRGLFRPAVYASALPVVRAVARGQIHFTGIDRGPRIQRHLFMYFQGWLDYYLESVEPDRAHKVTHRCCSYTSQTKSREEVHKISVM